MSREELADIANYAQKQTGLSGMYILKLVKEVERLSKELKEAHRNIADGGKS